ncbi:MAG: ABC transporter permease [Thermomicrobiales bacterium]|nr:ABC transporter permease [Thermomicrobiales bacterium]
MRSRGERAVDLIAALFVALVLLALYSPVLINALFSVVALDDGRIVWESFSLAPYRSVWSDPDVIASLRNTVQVALFAVGAATVLAVLFALYTDREGAVGRQAMELTIYLPFLLPPIVTGLSLLVASAQLGVSRGIATIVVGHTVFVLAVTYRLVRTRLEAMPRSLVEASSDLGASSLQTFRHILLPYLLSAIVTGALLALTLSFDETLITVFLSGDRMTLPLRLWAMMRVGFTQDINALVTVVLAISIALAIAISVRMKPAEFMD